MKPGSTRSSLSGNTRRVHSGRPPRAATGGNSRRQWWRSRWGLSLDTELLFLQLSEAFVCSHGAIVSTCCSPPQLLWPASQTVQKPHDNSQSIWCSPSLWLGLMVETASLSSVQVGTVSHIDFSPVYPFHYAITSSTRVIIYDALTRQVWGWLSQQGICKVWRRRTSSGAGRI